MSNRTRRSTKPKEDRLEGLAEARKGGTSRLDQVELDEDTSIYNTYTEEEYEKIVADRRKGSNFVVDDGGLGYHDDGEEVLGVGEDAYDAKKRLKEAARDGDIKVSKKAKLLAEASAGQKNSILRHIQTGAKDAGQRRGSTKEAAPQSLLDIDALFTKGGASGSGGGGSGRFASRSSSQQQQQQRAGVGGVGSRATLAAAATQNSATKASRFAHMQNYDNDDYQQQQDDGYGGDEYTGTASDFPLKESSFHQPSMGIGGNSSSSSGGQKRHSSGDADIEENRQHEHGEVDDASAGVTVKQENASDSTANNSSSSSQQQQKMSLTQAKKKFKAPEAVKIEPTTNSTRNDDGSKPLLNDRTFDAMTNLSEFGNEGAGSGPTTGSQVDTAEAGLSNIGSGVKIDPKLWLQNSKPAAEGEASYKYVNMFWLDATENNGVIYLFGKVAVQDVGAPKRYVSCCVAVHGNERNLFVLPRRQPDRFKEDGSACRASIGEVYGEISALLVPEIIPRQQGQGFRAKPVQRNYAFEYEEGPREKTEYMKVVYNAKYPAPSTAMCQNGGKHYEKIFGATSSALELFLLKRKLMGPCWISIKTPSENPDVISWCRLEIAVENPKLITKVPSNEAPPPPPLASICISMKTAVNPSTHSHEIVALSGLVHTKVDSEADSEMHPNMLKRFVIVRQLGVSCGSAYPAVFPHDLQQELKKGGVGANMGVVTVPNERALLNLFFAKMLQMDPDIITSHNLLGFEYEVLLSRTLANKLPNWSLLGRLKKSRPPKNSNDPTVSAGRILCDTYKAAKEFLRETTYSLTSLTQSQLGIERIEVDPVDVPRYFANSADVVRLATHTAYDSLLVQRLMMKLQIIPLTKQLTCLSGNLWSRTMRGARAERIEYLLLHEFHALKYVLPEKKSFGDNTGSGNSGSAGGKKGSGGNKNMASIEDAEFDMEGGGGGKGVGGSGRKRAKAAYAGGLVLEPKKGLYDTLILLLDFNSLYPSIIQEYNLCFTTIDWTKFMSNPSSSSSSSTSAGASSAEAVRAEKDDDSDGDDDKAVAGAGAAATGGGEEGVVSTELKAQLPPIPEGAAPGILPRVIKTLVDRRRQVKALLKNEKDPAVRQQLDIRQKALKLTANSMYGCLGFTFSRFYARPVAALVTAMGREALQRTVTLSTNQMGLDVIYGDTDSVMINTNITDLAKVKELGMQVKKEVNKMYNCLELDLDGIFKSMLLLKKKKYAAVTITENADGSVTLEKELKGLDLVRRDWCPLSKNAGKYVVDQILSGNSREDIVMTIHDYMSEVADKMRKGEIDLAHFVVTKGLNKNPKDYPDVKSQAHLQVALRMLAENKPVNIGDHIPYVICAQTTDSLEGKLALENPGASSAATSSSSPPGTAAPATTAVVAASSNAGIATRAYHPDEVLRANGALTLDYEWYLSNQLLPPISRLCEPIEGTSQAILSEKLGLDASKYARSGGGDGLDGDNWGFTAKCQMDDAERFKDCRPLTCKCLSCKKESSIKGVITIDGTPSNSFTLNCEECGTLYFGHESTADIFCHVSNRVTHLVRECTKKYYDCWLVCDDHSCGRRTMQQPTRGNRCTENCHGQMVPEYDDVSLHTQLKYLQSLFDLNRLMDKKSVSKETVQRWIDKEHMHVYDLLHKQVSHTVDWSAYNWVRPSLWDALFGKVANKAAAAVSGKAGSGL